MLKRWWPLAVKGAAGVCFQVVFFREVIAAFFGNEFSLALAMSAWLVGGAAGSLFASRFTSHVSRIRADRRYFRLTLAQCAAAVAALLAFRYTGCLPGVSPGQSPPLSVFIAGAGLACAVVGFCEGARFVLLAARYRDEKSGGRMYGAEGFGALAGGLLVSLLFRLGVNPFVVFFAAGAANLATGFSSWRPAVVAVWVLAGIFLAPVFERVSLDRQWRPFRVMESRYSVYGHSVVLERAGELALVRDGLPQTTTRPDLFTLKNEVFFGFLFHPGPRRVLVVGDPALAAEAAVYPSVTVYYADIDPGGIELLKKYFIASGKGKTRLAAEDPFRFLSVAREPFDVILISGTDPLSLAANRLFTREFAALARARLVPGGIVALSLPGGAEYLSPSQRRVQDSVRLAYAGRFARARTIPSDPVLHLFSDDNVLSRRYPDESPDRALFNDAYIAYVLDPGRASVLNGMLDSAGAQENTQAQPAALYYGIAGWFSSFDAGIGQVFSSFTSALSRLSPAAWALAVLAAALCALPAGPASSLYGIALANGFAVMSCETVLLFLFQLRCGYLYFALSLLIALFMAGLGCGGMASAGRAGPGGKLVATQLFHACFYLLLFIFFQSAIRNPQSAIVFLAMSVCGFLAGWEFGLATGLYERPIRSQAVGRLYGLDLLGGVLGCGAVPFLLIPVFGLYGSFLVLAAVKAGNLVSARRAGF